MKAVACMMLAAVVLLAHNVQAKGAAPSWKYSGIPAKDVPQMILFTHDDNTDRVSLKAVTEITRKHSNPNGCKINAAFYTTGQLSDCKSVKALYNIGHEIAGHTMTHRDLSKMSTSEKKKEIVGIQNWIAKCGVPKSAIWGHRSPFLSDDATVRDILQQAGFKYDTSIPEVFDSPTSPSAQKRLLPYSMTKGVAQQYSCKWFDNINHCTSSERHPGLMEIPLWMYQKSSDTPSAQDLMDPVNPYSVLKAEFDRNYAANRAPVGIWTHTSTGYLTKKGNRDQISKFLSYALAKKDVWVVTPRQLVQYMRNPVPASQMASFMARTGGCSKTGIPRAGLVSLSFNTTAAPLPIQPIL